MSDGHSAALLSLGLRDAAIGLSLIHLQLRADVAANVHVGDIDGENLEGGTGVQTLAQHGTADQVGVLQNLLVRLSGTDGGDDTFADTGDDGFLTGAADEALNVRADGHAGLGTQFNAVLCDCGDDGGLDDLGGNTHLHGFEHVAAGKVDGAGLLKRQLNVRALGGDQGVGDTVDVTAGQEVRFQLADGQIQTGLVGLDQRVNQTMGLDAAHAHTNQRTDGDMHAAGQRADPQADGEEAQEHADDDQRQSKNEDDPHEFHTITSLLFQAAGAAGCSPVISPARQMVRTRMRPPSTRMICTAVPLWTKSPSLTTFSRTPSNSAMPVGRSTVVVTPSRPRKTSISCVAR